MFLNTTSTTNPARRSLDPRRMARTLASATTTTLIEQARRIRLGHLSFVLGLTVAAIAVVSLGAVESGTSPARPQDVRQAAYGLAASKILPAPISFILVGSQDEADTLMADTYYLLTESSGSIVLPTVRIIGSTEDEHQLQDELSTMTYHGVDYRITDARSK